MDFEKAVGRIIQQLMADLMERWERRPMMVADYGDREMPPGTPTYVPYRQPEVVQTVVEARLGLAAFVTAEQIDHLVDDPQMRYAVWLVKVGEETRMIFEDHAYQRRERRSATVTIVELQEDSVVLSTDEGQRVVKI